MTRLLSWKLLCCLCYVAHERNMFQRTWLLLFSTFQLALKNDGLFCPFGEGRESKGVADNDPSKVKRDNIFATSGIETRTLSHARKLSTVELG